MSAPVIDSSTVESAPAASPQTEYIDEDLFCLTCGYNLRGLTGDPVRCPECGEDNDLGDCAIPARFIQQALEQMEGVLVRCLSCAAVVLFCGTVVLLAPGTLKVFGVLGGFFLGVWLLVLRMARQYLAAQAGWGWLLFEFHLAFVLGSLVLPISLMKGLPMGRPLLSTLGLPGSLALVIAGLAAMVGMKIHFGARTRLGELRREEAVRIAREMLRTRLRAPRAME